MRSRQMGGRMLSVSYLKEKAAHCRRMAAELTDSHAVAALLAMAEELETRAAELARRDSGEAD